MNARTALWGLRFGISCTTHHVTYGARAHVALEPMKNALQLCQFMVFCQFCTYDHYLSALVENMLKCIPCLDIDAGVAKTTTASFLSLLILQFVFQMWGQNGVLS